VKRTFWAMVGAGFGFGMSFWAMRLVRRLADRWLPAPLLERVQRTLDSLDGGTGARRPAPEIAVQASGDPYPWRTSGSTHPSVSGLRALTGGRRAGGR
jgi:hypothetical protein